MVVFTALNGVEVLRERAIALAANQPPQFYAGGAAIAEFRGRAETDHRPEDWVGSTTTLFGHTKAGLSMLPDGRLIRDAINADPVWWLGERHVVNFGANSALLVKLLDAGQRLPVHCHPSDEFAARHFDSRFGKTEAWIVVGVVGENPTVYLGFRDDISADQLAYLVAQQDSNAMLGSLNRLTVQPGDAVFVPAGVPHAIGPGIFVIELQQPTDFSITLEWQGFLSDAAKAHLGIGFDTALAAVNRLGQSNAVSTLIKRANSTQSEIASLFSPAGEAFFRADRLQTRSSLTLSSGFSIYIVLAGNGEINSLPAKKGATVLVPYSAGETTLTGELTVIRCRPPKGAKINANPQ